MTMKLFCVLVGAAGSPFPVEIAASESVGDLKALIKAKKPLKITGAARQLKLYLAKKGGDTWLPSNDQDVVAMETGAVPDKIHRQLLLAQTLDPTDKIREVFVQAPTKKVIHVLVVLPTMKEVGAAGSSLLQHQEVVWFGTRTLISVGGEGIDVTDPRTLRRATLTTEILRRLDKTHVLLVKSPPMTGKSWLATLVSSALVERSTQDKQKMVVFNFSAVSTNESFEDSFKRQCGVEWQVAVATLPTQTRYVVYLVVDETQEIYPDGTRSSSSSSSARKSSGFWEFVKYIMSNTAYNVRILMFATYGLDVVYSRLGFSIQFNDELVLSNKQLDFSHVEVVEFVTRWFKGIACFGDSSAAIENFCSTLEELTGGHVGLCATAIDTLDEVFVSRQRSARDLPSPHEWTCMLQSGSLYQPDDGALFDALASTRAVSVLKTLDMDELDRLERCGDADIVEQSLRKGILAQNRRQIDFSSPVMWRFFVKMRVGEIVRPIHVAPPQSLPEMVTRVVQAIDYESIHQTLIRKRRSGLTGMMPLEKVWQMEFYKAAYRCTPSSFVTSVDEGALFGSSGFIDFTIHGGDGSLWGIELLQDASNLSEHIARFETGGRYSLLGLSDFCLIDFRRVPSLEDTAVVMERIAADCRCEKLVVVWYEPRLARVVVFNSAIDVLYRIPSE